MADTTLGFEGALSRRMARGTADAFNADLSQQLIDKIMGRPALAAPVSGAGTASSAAQADSFGAPSAAPPAAPAAGGSRIINFEGRRITVPADTTDDEIREILAAPAAPSPGAPPQAGPGSSQIIEVEAPDGSIVEFPPDTPHDVMTKAMRAKFGGPAPAPRGPQMTPQKADLAVSGLSVSAKPEAPKLQGDSLGGIAKAAGQGVVSGMDMLLDAPVQAINQAPRLLNINGWLVNKIMGRDVVPTVGPISDKPFLPSDILHAPDRALGSRQYEPQGPVERVANRVGQEVGASALPAGGALIAGANLGIRGARALALSENPLAAIASAPVEAAAANPRGMLGREGLGALFAGGGAGVANEAARAITGDQHNPVSDLLGSAAGVSALAVAKPIAGAVGSLASAARGSTRFADDVARETVANEVIANSSEAQRQIARGVDLGALNTQPLADQLRRPSRAEEVIPGYQSDIADRSGDAGLASYVFGNTSASPGRDTVRRAANQTAVGDRLTELQPTGSPGQFRADLQTGVDTRIAGAETQASAAEAAAQRLIEAIRPQQTPQARGATVRTAVDDALQRFIADVQARHAAAGRAADEASARILPQSDPAVRGDVVRGSLETARDEARQRTSNAYAAANIDDRTAQIAPLTSSIDEALRGMTAVERGLVPQGLVDRVTRLGRQEGDGAPVNTGLLDASGQPITRPTPAPDPARLKEVTDLRSELDRAQRNAMADPRAENGGRNAARVIGQLQDRVERFIGAQMTAEEQATFQAARGAKFDEAESFARQGDPVAAAVARRPGGQPMMRDERVAGSFVNPATEQPLNRLFAEADTPAVRGAIRDEIASRIGADARNDPARLDRFLADYEIPLRQVPGLRDEIAGASAARRGAADAEAAVGARRQEFVGDSRALADTSARRGDGTPALLDEQIPGRFVNTAGNRDLDALFTRADTPEVRAALEDEILGRVQGAANRPDALRRQVEGLREPLSRFPGLAERITSAADAGEASAAARGVADTTRRDLTTPGRSPEAAYLRYDEAGTVRSMHTVLGAARPAEAAERLLATAGTNPEHARAAFWEALKDRATVDGGLNEPKQINGRRGNDFLSDPQTRAVAEVLYRDQPQQLADISDVFSALAGANSATRARRPGSSGTAQGMRAGYDAALSASSIASRIRSVHRGQLSPTIAGIDLIATFLRRKSAQLQSGAISRLRDEVVQNPELAARLLDDYNPATYGAKRRELQTAYGARATEAIKLLDMAHDERERPEAAAVLRSAGR